MFTLLCAVLVIGFQPDQYSAVEGVDTTVDLIAMVISGSLGTDVSISFTTRDVSAVGKLVLICIASSHIIHTHTHTPTPHIHTHTPTPHTHTHTTYTPTPHTHTHTHTTPTHTAGSDYTTTSQTLTFTPTTDSRSGTVGILEDDSVELEENFEGFLFVDTPIDRLTITPTVATVTIGDTDSEYTLCVCVRLLHQLFQ